MFWDRFYNLCIQHGTKPNPLGKEIGISSGIITKWKNGAIPNGETLIKIANYLNCSIDYLLIGEEKPNLNKNKAVPEKDFKYNRLTALRKKHGISLEEVCELIGEDKGTVSMYESNMKQPNYSTLEKLSEFYNVSVEYLMGISDAKNDDLLHDPNKSFVMTKGCGKTNIIEVNKCDQTNIIKVNNEEERKAVEAFLAVYRKNQ